MAKRLGIAGLFVMLCAFFVFWAGAASGVPEPPFADDEDTTPTSGV